MEEKLNVLRLIIALVLGYVILFIFMWLFGKKKSPEKEIKKER